MNSKIHSFTDLNAWQKGHRLVLKIYKLTKSFPSEERYGLSDQMRRCSVSITSNIAEGFSRRGKKEKAQFFYMALGSTTEIQNQLLIARDIKYFSQQEFQELANLTVEVNKLVNGLIKSSRILNT